MKPRLSATILRGQRQYSRGKGHPALLINPTTNERRRFCVAIAAGTNEGIIYTTRRKCKFLAHFIHHTAPQQLRMHTAFKLASRAHCEFILDSPKRFCGGGLSAFILMSQANISLLSKKCSTKLTCLRAIMKMKPPKKSISRLRWFSNTLGGGGGWYNG